MLKVHSNRDSFGLRCRYGLNAALAFEGGVKVTERFRSGNTNGQADKGSQASSDSSASTRISNHKFPVRWGTISAELATGNKFRSVLGSGRTIPFRVVDECWKSYDAPVQFILSRTKQLLEGRGTGPVILQPYKSTTFKLDSTRY